MSFRSLSPAALLILATAPAAAQDAPVPRALDRFQETCAEAMAAPSRFVEDARAGGAASEIAVARVPDEALYWVLDMAPPGEFYVHIGEIGGDIRVFCYLGLMNEPAVRDAAATDAAFRDWAEGKDGLELTGGAVDLRALMAGDASAPGAELELTAQVYHHLMAGWSAAGAIASVAIQVGMIEIDAEIRQPGPLEIAPAPGQAE
ncbi:hypothetical protein [Roseivivax sp. CAU 1761]